MSIYEMMIWYKISKKKHIMINSDTSAPKEIEALFNQMKNSKVKIKGKRTFMDDVFTEKLLVIASKISSQRHMTAIKNAFTALLPIIITGSFCTLFANVVCSTTTTGISLANIQLKEIFNDFIVYSYTLIKQTLIPLIAFPIICYFIKDTLIQGVTLSAVLFATEYDGDITLATKLFL